MKIDIINGSKVVPLKYRDKEYINMYSGNQHYFLDENGNLFKIQEMSTGENRPSANIDGVNITIAQAMLESWNGSKDEWILSDDAKPEDVSINDWKNTPDSVKKALAKNGVDVDHINGDSSDNRLSNLQYLYRHANVMKGGKKK